MVIFYKKWKKYNEIQLTKNKMDLNNRKITNHPPSPVEIQLRKKQNGLEQSNKWKIIHLPPLIKTHPY